MAGMSIGALARKSNVKVANIRFYEQAGLMPEPDRREGGHRNYGREDVARLTFIRTCRELGFPLEQIKTLLHLARPENMHCTEAAALARAQLASVRERIETLKTIETQLAGHLDACTQNCCDTRAPACELLPHLP